jgi:hypothetical protein
MILTKTSLFKDKCLRRIFKKATFLQLLLRKSKEMVAVSSSFAAKMKSAVQEKDLPTEHVPKELKHVLLKI